MGRLRRAGRGASLDAAKWDDAQAAAPKLDSFEQGLGATHDAGSPAHNVLIGHSYGSSVVGEAAKSAHGLGNLGVDDVIAVGSPGMDVNSASDLGVDPGLPNSLGYPHV